MKDFSAGNSRLSTEEMAVLDRAVREIPSAHIWDQVQIAQGDDGKVFFIIFESGSEAPSALVLISAEEALGVAEDIRAVCLSS